MATDSRLHLDTERCIGSGECVMVAPQAFELGDEGAAVVLDGIADLDDDQLEEIEASCPSGAIQLRRAE